MGHKDQLDKHAQCSARVQRDETEYSHLDQLFRG